MSFYYSGTTYYLNASKEDVTTGDELALIATLFPGGFHIGGASEPFEGAVAPHLEPFTQVKTYTELKGAWCAPELTELPKDTPLTHAVPHIRFHEKDGQPFMTLHIPVSCEESTERDAFNRDLDALLYAVLGKTLLGGKRKVGTVLDSFETLPFEEV